MTMKPPKPELGRSESLVLAEAYALRGAAKSPGRAEDPWRKATPDRFVEYLANSLSGNGKRPRLLT
jgi:hypothetical protein